jgi:hypothetical protein
MTFRVLWMLKRKDGISFEQFRDHFENSHAELGKKYLGHLFVDYKRHYKAGTAGGGVPTQPGASALGQADWQYDAIVEWVMPNEEALDEIMRIFADPVIGKAFYDDEEHFLDRNAVFMFKCDTRETGVGDGAETLKLRGRM